MCAAHREGNDAGTAEAGVSLLRRLLVGVPRALLCADGQDRGLGRRSETMKLTAEQEAELDHAYGYHAPTPEQIEKYAAINAAAKQFERAVLENCPGSADRTFATRQIRDARMTANCAIALHKESR
jgi:hypothetical protein